MKLKEKYITTLYLVYFCIFIFAFLFYVPMPKLNKFSYRFDNDNRSFVSTLDLNKSNLSRNLKRKINIGNSYEVVYDNQISFKITPLSFLSIDKFNLSDYAKFLPELIFDTDQIKLVNQNNYGIKNELGEKYQACLFDFDGPSFLYKLNSDQVVYRYDDLKYWIYVIKREAYNFFESEAKNFNCLLITTTNADIFEKDFNKILKIISNNFVLK